MKTHSNFLLIDIFECKKKVAKFHSIDQFHTFKKIKFRATTTNFLINEKFDIRFIKPTQNNIFVLGFNANRYKKMISKKTTLTIYPEHVIHYYNCQKISVPLTCVFKTKQVIYNNSSTNIIAAESRVNLVIYTLT